jgi:hypothetical protein
MKRELLGSSKARKSAEGNIEDEHFGDEKDTRPFWRRVNATAGLPLWEAMLFYGNQCDADIAFCRRLEGFDRPPFDHFDEMSREEQREYNVGSMELQRARRQLESEIAEKLASGELFATGYAGHTPLDSPAERILPDRWRLLEPDFLESSARGSGIEISGILVFKGESSTVPVAIAKRHSTAELRRWYSTWVQLNKRNGKQPSREEDLKAARQEFGDRAHRATLRALRLELAPKEWKQHGRRKQG